MADTCSIHGCTNKRFSRGWCSTHFARWKRHGDPEKRALVEYGKPLQWLRLQSDYASDDCLIWPFGGNGNGYGQVRFNGKKGYPHRIMCELTHGKAPSVSHQAAHSCGNRACVNPRHLRWADQSGNEGDKLAHGTHNRGEQHPLSKLTEADVRQIRALKGKMTQREIAKLFGVGSAHVCRVLKGGEWGWLDHA